MSTVVRTSEVLSEREVNGEISIYHHSNQSVTVLNAAASQIWRLTAEPMPIEDIISWLAGVYQLEPDDVRNDVEETINRLHQARLIEIVGTEGG
jgi:hypothetical protein